MVNTVDILVEKRDSTKATILWLETKIVNHAAHPLTEAMVETYLTMANTAHEELIDNFKRISALALADMNPHNLEHFTLLDKVQPVQWELQAIKAAFAPVVPHSPPPHHHHPHGADIRLPRLELPSFNGNIQNWMSFHDMFVATVHNSTTLTKAQKLTYLKSSLTGEAERQIKSIIVTDDNYDTAWAQLGNRYHNERELLYSVLRRFFGQAQVPGNAASALRSLIDVSTECLRSCESLHLPVDQWDAIILFQMSSKLDTTTREMWEQTLNDSTIPPLKGFLEFLEQRARALAAGGSTHAKGSPHQGKADVAGPNHQRRVAHAHHVPATTNCKICKGGHLIFSCPKFLSMTVPERQEVVKKYYLCFNCLREGHSLNQCTRHGTCKTCNGKHNTLLHRDKPNEPVDLIINHHSNDETRIQQTLLATAVVRVKDRNGQYQLVRALMDGGSNASFITESCVKSLGIPRHRNDSEILGLASASIGIAKGATFLTVCPNNSGKESYSVQALILPKVTSRLPLYKCDPSVWSHLNGLDFADPLFFEPGQIDLLLGADMFYNTILAGKRIGPDNSPVAVKTTLGWLIAGNLNTVSTQVSVHYADVDLDKQLQQFWEIETICTTRTMTQDEEHCENHFTSTHMRNEEGRFVVQLPFKSPKSSLGSSRDQAVRRLKQLESRFGRHPDRQQQYRDFMTEYLSLGHMQEIPQAEIVSPLVTCYIPHRYVVKESSATTKLRVVFDASSKTSTGVSLNDTLLVGPTIQDNLTDILTRFRLHPLVLVADIAKMYRQFLVHPTDADCQRIVWRDQPNQIIKDYRLTTVTYGTASAPFLATRSLQQLAIEYKDTLPLAYTPTMKDFYVDNLMTGAQTLEEALNIQDQIQQLMANGGMELRQWSSNSSALLECIPVEMRDLKPLMSLDVDQKTKTLGVYWNPVKDEFSFKVTLDDIAIGSNLTKRKLLSEVSKIFDPLGWLAPTIIRAKILIQDLWKLNLGWDDPLPEYIIQEWYVFRSHLYKIETLTIARCITPFQYTIYTLHGFCDASEKAYAAVVYLCAFNNQQVSRVSQITAKTRVAPAKQVSLPRLELCGALLLAQLLMNVKTTLGILISNTKLWTDSTVVLAWIQAHPSRWKTFVANRVTEVQGLFPYEFWGHVSGIENPADCASRGIDPSELQYHPLWWTGPNWLKADRQPTCDTFNIDHTSVSMESRQVVICNCVLSSTESQIISSEEQQIIQCSTAVTHDQSLLQQYSSLRTLKRVTAFILRFIHNCRLKIQIRKKQFPGQVPKDGALTTMELQSAIKTWVRIVQHEQFHREILCLEKNHQLPNQSTLRNLNPFLDHDGIIRVGGRLRKSNLPSAQKYPMILPRHNQFTRLLIASKHLEHLHAGPQLLLSIIHRQYWIINARDAIRHQLKKCVICARNKATLLQQFMGNYPAARITPSQPFQNCGIDYAGPFLIRPISPRSKITLKAYLAVFICFATHAIHLEVVSELSTPAFIAALHRFISRRGKPSHMYSDCGTNFVGAAKEITETIALLQSVNHNKAIADKLSNEGIQWHFNPPGAPHFGGLWEAGVKSVKYHLRRVVGLARLTFEELTTTMTQIEAGLNSRPLTPVSSDPNDLEALTPGHFLIGSALTALPEADLQSEKVGRLSRWQMVQQLQQQFWHRWSNEFIARLQQRPKWLKHRVQIQIGDMVIIKDDNLPPLKWRLGRVIQIHPGSDDLTRVVTLLTSSGEVDRPIVKLCLLPMDPASSVNSSENNIPPIV